MLSRESAHILAAGAAAKAFEEGDGTLEEVKEGREESRT